MKPEIKIIKDFLEALDIKKLIKVRAKKGDTYAILEDKIIFFDRELYTKKYAVVGQRTMRILKEKGLNFATIHYGTFAVLHEIGHIIMISKYSDPDAEIEKYASQLDRLQEQFDKNCIDFDEATAQEKSQVAYRNLKMEHDADKKAYELYTSFPEEVKALDELMKKECGD